MAIYGTTGEAAMEAGRANKALEAWRDSTDIEAWGNFVLVLVYFVRKWQFSVMIYGTAIKARRASTAWKLGG